MFSFLRISTTFFKKVQKDLNILFGSGGYRNIEQFAAAGLKRIAGRGWFFGFKITGFLVWQLYKNRIEQGFLACLQPGLTQRTSMQVCFFQVMRIGFVRGTVLENSFNSFFAATA